MEMHSGQHLLAGILKRSPFWTSHCGFGQCVFVQMDTSLTHSHCTHTSGLHREELACMTPLWKQAPCIPGDRARKAAKANTPIPAPLILRRFRFIFIP